MKHKEYIVLQIPATDTTKYTMRYNELLDIFKRSGIDTSNVLAIPNDISISCLKLPITDDEVEDDSNM